MENWSVHLILIKEYPSGLLIYDIHIINVEMIPSESSLELL